MGPADSGTTGGAAAAAAADGGAEGGSAAGAAAAAAGGGWCTPFPLPLAPSAAAAAAEGSFRLSRGAYVPALFVTMSLSFCARGVGVAPGVWFGWERERERAREGGVGVRIAMVIIAWDVVVVPSSTNVLHRFESDGSSRQSNEINGDQPILSIQRVQYPRI